jgi:hypothetical protein
MKYVFGKIFTWLWIGVTIFAAVYSGKHMRLEEMKIFGTILVILIGSFFIALAAAWDKLGPIRDALPKTFVSGLLGWLFARQWGAVVGVVLMLIYMFVRYKFFPKDDAEPEQTFDENGQPVDEFGEPIVSDDSDNIQVPPEVSKFVQEYVENFNKNPANKVDSDKVFTNVNDKFPKLSPILDGAKSLVPNDIFNNLLQTNTMQLINNMLDKAPVDDINKYITPYITSDKVEVAQEAIELLKAIPEQIRTDFINEVLPIDKLIGALNVKPEELGDSLKALEPELQKLPAALQNYGKKNAFKLIRHSAEFLQIAKKLPGLLQKIKNINPLSSTGHPGLATPQELPEEIIQQASDSSQVNADKVLQNVGANFPTLAPTK